MERLYVSYDDDASWSKEKISPGQINQQQCNQPTTNETIAKLHPRHLSSGRIIIIVISSPAQPSPITKKPFLKTWHNSTYKTNLLLLLLLLPTNQPPTPPKLQNQTRATREREQEKQRDKDLQKCRYITTTLAIHMYSSVYTISLSGRAGG